MDWTRGKLIGEGLYAKVYLATPAAPTSEFPPLMAVKSALTIYSPRLQIEKQVLTDLKGCPQVIQCYGDDTTIEDHGQTFYNVFLEYAPNGDLLDLIEKAPIGEADARRYTRSILRGLRCIHKKGYVHSDIKPHNILVFPTDDGKTDVKIADVGLARRIGSEESKDLRGTLLYLSPESIARKEHTPGCDVWALGCVVAEMVTGMNAWKWDTKAEDIKPLLHRLLSDELPEIPRELSEQGKDFLRKCWERDCSKRWSVEKLLKHPFVVDENLDESQRSLVDERAFESSKSTGGRGFRRRSSSEDSFFPFNV